MDNIEHQLQRAFIISLLSMKRTVIFQMYSLISNSFLLFFENGIQRQHVRLLYNSKAQQRLKFYEEKRPPQIRESLFRVQIMLWITEVYNIKSNLRGYCGVKALSSLGKSVHETIIIFIRIIRRINLDIVKKITFIKFPHSFR